MLDYRLLRLSIFRGDTETIRRLVGGEEPTADVNRVSPITGASPLLFACMLGNVDVVRVLLRYGANPSVSTIAGNTPLLASVERGDVRLARMLLQRGVDPDATSNACSPLILAIDRGDEAMVCLLVSHGADPNDGIHQWNHFPPLLHATQRGRIGVMCALLAMGADPNGACSHGYTATMQAAQNDDVDAMELLLSSGADISLWAAPE